jgi:hypothetical protein
LTYALVTEGLGRGAADYEPKDGRVMAREWLDYASERVPRLQMEWVDEARKVGRTLTFTVGERAGGFVPYPVAQHPRVFYRREIEEEPWLIAEPTR